MEIKKILESKTFKILTWLVASLIVLLLIFKLGMLVGERKAGFTYRWSENYHRNFAGPQGGFMPGFSDRDFIEASGVFGQIIKIDGANLVVQGRDNVEKIVITNDQTTIERLKDTIKLTDLKVDDYIVVIGEPNDAGQIEAKFIRVMPPTPAGPQGMRPLTGPQTRLRMYNAL